MARHKTPTAEVSAYLTSAEVAQTLAVSPQALSYWRAKNVGPPSHKLVGSVRYPRAEFEAWLARQRENTTRGEQVPA